MQDAEQVIPLVDNHCDPEENLVHDHMRKDALQLKDGRVYRASFNTRVLVYICFHSFPLLLLFRENCTVQVKSLSWEESIMLSLHALITGNLCSELKKSDHIQSEVRLIYAPIYN